jgi:hypothetical protein
MLTTNAIKLHSMIKISSQALLNSEIFKQERYEEEVTE